MEINFSGILEGFLSLAQVLMKIDFYVMVAGAVMLCLVVLLVAVLKHQ
jgi:hypothetical protein